MQHHNEQIEAFVAPPLFQKEKSGTSRGSSRCKTEIK
jgi:hypothetical protein